MWRFVILLNLLKVLIYKLQNLKNPWKMFLRSKNSFWCHCFGNLLGMCYSKITLTLRKKDACYYVAVRNRLVNSLMDCFQYPEDAGLQSQPPINFHPYHDFHFSFHLLLTWHDTQLVRISFSEESLTRRRKFCKTNIPYPEPEIYAVHYIFLLHGFAQTFL